MTRGVPCGKVFLVGEIDERGVPMSHDYEYCLECEFEEHNCQCCSLCCEAGHDEDECLLGASA